MALKTRSNPMGALGTKMYTLTVTTDPSSATCTLTYDGESYSGKTAEVKAGTVISYSIYHSTYGTTTGSITMNGNKTLTCNGTYSTSTSYSDVTFSRPNLTSNGTLGGASFAVYAYELDSSTSYQAWQAVDSSSTSTGVRYRWGSKIKSDGEPCYYIFYNPDALKVSSLTITNPVSSVGNNAMGTGVIYGSNDNSNWTSIKSFTNTNRSNSSTWTISVNSSNYYKYHKINCTASVSNTANYKVVIGNIAISAVYKSTSSSYTYYWDKTIS